MYGASAQRVDALGPGTIGDIDINRMAMVGLAERGVDIVHKDIFNMADFTLRLGGFNPAKISAFVAKSFFDTLERGINVRMLFKPVVASDAVQAVRLVLDTNSGTPQTVYTVSAGLLNNDDKSAFGNKIGTKFTTSENKNVGITTVMAATSTTAIVESVEFFKVGYLVRITDTAKAETEFRFITAVDPVTKTITFAALTSATTWAIATTTIFRQDVNLELAVRNDDGIFELREVGRFLEQPFIKSDLDGLSFVTNNVVNGSFFVKIVFNTGNTSPANEVLPAVDADFVALGGDTAGSDGTSPNEADFKAATQSFNDEIVSILLNPEFQTVSHHVNNVDDSTDGTKWIYYAAAPESATEATLKNQGTNTRKPIAFAMFPVDKWFDATDPNNTDRTIRIPGVGHAAAHFYNVANTTGIQKNAAGNIRPVNTVDNIDESNGLIHDDVAGVGQRLIEDHSINIVRDQENIGVTINSARTVSTNTGYIFQNQLFGFWFIKNSILRFLKDIEQDVSGSEALAERRAIVVTFLRKLFNQGVFFKGTRKDGKPTGFRDVVIVVSDFTNNTLEAIANGEEVTFVQVVFPPPVEKPTLQLASAATTTIRG